MSAVIFIQQRLGSTRFPKKAVAMIGPQTMTEHVVERAEAAVGEDRVVVGVPYKDYAIPVRGSLLARIRGDEADLVRRMIRSVELLEATRGFERADVVVRLTGDCPLLPVDLIEATIACCEKQGGHVETRSDPSNRPNGIDVQAMSREVFEELKTTHGLMTPHQRQHITPSLWTGDWASCTLSHGGGRILSHIPYFDVSVDTQRDLERVRRVYHAGPPPWSLDDLVHLKLSRPELFE